MAITSLQARAAARCIIKYVGENFTDGDGLVPMTHIAETIGVTTDELEMVDSLDRIRDMLYDLSNGCYFDYLIHADGRCAKIIVSL